MAPIDLPLSAPLRVPVTLIVDADVVFDPDADVGVTHSNSDKSGLTQPPARESGGSMKSR